MKKSLIARSALPLALAIGLGASGLPALAQDAAAKPAAPDSYAGAVLRNDLATGIYEIADDADAGVIYVASVAGFGPGLPGYVWVLDRNDLSLKRKVELPDRAFALALDHEAGRLFVGNTLDGKLSILDAKTGTVTGTVQLGQKSGEGVEHTRMLAVDPATHRVYVTSPSDKGALWIVDGDKAELIKRVDDAGLWAAGLALDSAKGRVYVGGGGIEEIGVFDAASGARIAGFSTGDTTAPGKDDSRHFFVNLALDAKGGRLFAADSISGQIYVFDTESSKVLGKVATGVGTLDVAYGDSRDEIYVTTRGVSREAPKGSGTLLVIDGKDLTVKHTLSVPVHPNSLEVSQDGTLLFVSVKAPDAEDHPAFKKDALDSVLRFDLSKLD